MQGKKDNEYLNMEFFKYTMHIIKYSVRIKYAIVNSCSPKENGYFFYKGELLKKIKYLRKKLAKYYRVVFCIINKF